MESLLLERVLQKLSMVLLVNRRLGVLWRHPLVFLGLQALKQRLFLSGRLNYLLLIVPEDNCVALQESVNLFIPGSLESL